MAAAIGVRSDYTSADLRRLARRSCDADQVRRLLAMALILDGGSRSQAAQVAGVTLQIVRDWVLRFNEGGPDGLVTRKAPGRASILNDEQRARLAEIVEGPAMPPRLELFPGGKSVPDLFHQSPWRDQQPGKGNVCPLPCLHRLPLRGIRASLFSWSRAMRRCHSVSDLDCEPQDSPAGKHDSKACCDTEAIGQKIPHARLAPGRSEYLQCLAQRSKSGQDRQQGQGAQPGIGSTGQDRERRKAQDMNSLRAQIARRWRRHRHDRKHQPRRAQAKQKTLQSGSDNR